MATNEIDHPDAPGTEGVGVLIDGKPGVVWMPRKIEHGTADDRARWHREVAAKYQPLPPDEPAKPVTAIPAPVETTTDQEG